MEEAEIGPRMKPSRFTFVSISGAGNSLARGKSRRIVVIIRAPRKTKTMENLEAKRLSIKGTADHLLLISGACAGSSLGSAVYVEVHKVLHPKALLPKTGTS